MPGEEVIAEAYDVLRVVGGLTNEELEQVFTDWNKVGGWVGGAGGWGRWVHGTSSSSSSGLAGKQG